MSKAFKIIGIVCGVVALTVGSSVMEGQTEGENAIYPGSGTSAAASSAYIDASPFYSNTGQGNFDICFTIYHILNSTWISYPVNGAVIDARGALAQPGSNTVTCNSNPFPTTGAPPSTILLPAATIAISTTWILPSNTRIIGVGSGPQTYTALGAFSALASGSNAMIQMGPTGGSATGVVIEHMQLNGGSVGNFDGIDNASAGDGSYVDDVHILNIGATSSGSTSTGACSPSGGAVASLCISTGATYSGPYTNLNVVPSTKCSATCPNTACVKIQAQTRGLHGISCVSGSSQSSWPLAAIYLDAYGNSIENVHVEGFKDAIVVGDNADGKSSLTTAGSVSENVIANVVGSSGNGPVQDTVHICNSHWTHGFIGACSGNSLPVDNLTILQAKINSTVTGSEVIQDDNVTWQASTGPSGGILYTALYAVGSTDPTTTTGPEARFTTMPGNSSTIPAPTWVVGPAPTSTNCTNFGAIFSNPAGAFGSSNTIFVCSGGAWQGIK